MYSEVSQDPARLGAILFSELLRHPDLKGTWDPERSANDLEENIPAFFKDPENPFSFYFGYRTKEREAVFLPFQLDLKEGKWRFNAGGMKRRFASLEKLVKGILTHFEKEQMLCTLKRKSHGCLSSESSKNLYTEVN